MTGENLIDRLGERIEDSGEQNFNATFKANILNVAQDVMINLVDRRFFPTLSANVTNQSEPFECTAGALSGYTGRPSDIYEIKVNGGKVCEIIDVKEKHILDNVYTQGTTEHPIAYIDRNHIFVSPSSVTNIDISFYKNPTAIAHDSTAYPFSGLEDILLYLAESEIWKQDNKLERSNMAYQRAVEQINQLNQRVEIDSGTAD